MAKTVAPLLSFDAGGQIAKTQVYSKWKGRPYVRRYVVPANPNTSAQQLTRNTFRFLNDLWKFFPGGAIGAWNLYGDNSRFTARNGFLKLNVGPLRDQTDLDAMTISPAANGGIAAASMVVTPSAGTLTVVLTPPSLPTGWTVTSAFAAAIRDQDPQTGNIFTVVSGSDNSDPYSIALTGLTASQVYQVGGWFQYAKPDASLAFGQALQQQATPS